MEPSSSSCGSQNSDDAIKHCATFDIKGLAIWYHIVTCFLLALSVPANLYAWWKCPTVKKDKDKTTNDKSQENPTTQIDSPQELS